MSRSAPTPDPLGKLPRPRGSLVVSAVIGAAVMAAADEIVFHQILGWHHFYDRSTTAVGLLSDGLLHTAELLALVAGFFAYADLRRRHALAPAHARAGGAPGRPHGQAETHEEQQEAGGVPRPVVRRDVDPVADLVQAQQLVVDDPVEQLEGPETQEETGPAA